MITVPHDELAAEALAAGQVVWWSANDECPKVYHLPLADPPGKTNGALLLVNVVPEFLEKLPRPDLVFISQSPMLSIFSEL